MAASSHASSCSRAPPASACRFHSTPAPSAAAATLLPAGVLGTCPVRCRFLFQKPLSASDAGKLGRMVVPRCAGERGGRAGKQAGWGAVFADEGGHELLLSTRRASTRPTCCRLVEPS